MNAVRFCCRSPAAQHPIRRFGGRSRRGSRLPTRPSSPTTVDPKFVGQSTWSSWYLPLQYREHGGFSRQDATALLARIPLAAALYLLMVWDETSPLTLLRIHGPSMMPTIRADGSDIWIRSTWAWRKKLGLSLPYQRGDLVGFAHPSQPGHVSCKRIVGLPGDRVQRYGQYAHLFVRRDQGRLGISRIEEDDESHQWIQSLEWDRDVCYLDRVEEAKRTLIVPEGHVWIEGDCPALAIDSRHYGPIPEKWLKGKIIAQIWPTHRSVDWRSRPHPIQLDDETLAKHNVYRTLPNMSRSAS